MRWMLYSPDSYGLGHVRRTISLAEAMLSRHPSSRGLLLTGAPRAHYFDYPEGCDYLKLPSITKDAGGDYVSLGLVMENDQVVRLREGLIEFSTASFRPDLFWVDHAPAGLGGEVLPTLRRLGRKQGGMLRVLGLRDVIDEPQVVREAWSRGGIYDILRRDYDRIFVYGQRDLIDPIAAYAIPNDIAKKMRFVGYIPRIGVQPDPGLREKFAPRTGRWVLVTLGGGGDGDVLLKRFMEGYRALGASAPFEVAAVTGPLMSPRKRARFVSEASDLPGVSIVEYTDRMPSWIAAADLVVAMGGYNTVCELACAGSRAVIAPRVFPRREQRVRAERLAARGVVTALDSTDVAPSAFMTAVLDTLERDRPEKGWGLEFGGVTRAVEDLTPRFDALAGAS